MSFEIAHPLRLLVIPVCMALELWMAHIRKSRSLKERVSHILRHVLILLTALAFAGLSVLTASPDRTAWLVLDDSASVREEEVVSLARQALQEAGNDRKTGVIVFGRHAAVEKSIGGKTEWTGLYTVADRSASNLGEALSLASALLPTDTNGGIAVISDGAVTGTAEWAAGRNGIPVNTLKVERRTGPDAQVTEISVPDIEIPEIESPEVSIPEMEIPEIAFPDLIIPDLSETMDQLAAFSSGAMDMLSYLPALLEAASLAAEPVSVMQK